MALQASGILASSSIAPLNSQLAAGLEDVGQYQGTRPPNFYVVDLLVPNEDGVLRTGHGRYGPALRNRRSLAGLVAQDVANFFGRKVW